MAEGARTPHRCDLCGPPIDLGERGTLMVRHAEAGDETSLASLYATLGADDLLTRFFTPGIPARQFLERWVSTASNGGLCLLAELEHDGHSQVVAEAGFAPLSDGDVELGITIAADHRGWTGPWMLDLLLAHAAEAGIKNMQALVKTSNRPMLNIIRHRGCARFDDTDWETTRVTMATAGHTPSWPPEAKSPRVLIESPRSRPDVARRVREQSGTTLICGGFDRPGSHCPLHAGESCPLVAGADAVVIDGRSTPDISVDPDRVAAAIRAVHPDAHIIVADDASSAVLPHRHPMIDLELPECPTAADLSNPDPNSENEE